MRRRTCSGTSCMTRTPTCSPRGSSCSGRSARAATPPTGVFVELHRGERLLFDMGHFFASLYTYSVFLVAIPDDSDANETVVVVDRLLLSESDSDA